MRVNRRLIPKCVKSTKLKKGQMKIFTNFEQTIKIGVIRDKKKFLLLTTFDHFKKSQETVARAVENYNKFSKGVDRLNQFSQYYR